MLGGEPFAAKYGETSLQLPVGWGPNGIVMGVCLQSLMCPGGKVKS